MVSIDPSSVEGILDLFSDYLDDNDLTDEDLDADMVQFDLGIRDALDDYVATNRDELDATIVPILKDYMKTYDASGVYTKVGDYLWLVKREG